MNRLALGTAQFGSPYGIANAGGTVPEPEVRRILVRARRAGLDTLDTAAAYGDAESRLGRVGVEGWRVITKLPQVPDGVADVGRWMAREVEGALRRLRTDAVAGLLLHRPGQLLDQRGEELYGALAHVKDQGLAAAIGVSAYAPQELDALLGRYRLDLVQAPVSLLDRRLVESGWLERLAAQGVELHVRSVFLQGLLVLAPEARPPWAVRWTRLWAEWDDWLRVTGLTPLQACLRYALSLPDIARVVVGVDSDAQLERLLDAAAGPALEPPPALRCDDPDLLDPSRWPVL